MKKTTFNNFDEINENGDEFSDTSYLTAKGNNHSKKQVIGLRSALSAAFTITVTIILAVTLSVLLSPSNHQVDAATSSNTGITIHILDTSRGLPAQGVEVKLEFFDPVSSTWFFATSSQTNSNGRCDPFWPLNSGEELETGLYQMTFQTKPYFDSQNVSTFYPYVNVVFNVTNPVAHYHIPLLLSPYSYTTYRGS